MSSQMQTPIAHIGSKICDRSIEYEISGTTDITLDMTRANTLQKSYLLNYSEAIDNLIDINVEPYGIKLNSNPPRTHLEPINLKTEDTAFRMNSVIESTKHSSTDVETRSPELKSHNGTLPSWKPDSSNLGFYSLQDSSKLLKRTSMENSYVKAA